MNFIKAMKVVEAGGLVRRRGPEWRQVEGRGKTRRVSVNHIGQDEDGMYYRCGLPSAGLTVTCSTYFTMEDYLATNWMVVDPENP